jgi:hypothetical protein
MMELMKKIQTRNEMRSGCPINLTLEMLGDRWSLIVIRDIMFGNRRHYGDLLRLSEEGIASNILANRLARLAPSLKSVQYAPTNNLIPTAMRATPTKMNTRRPDHVELF